MVNKTRLVSLAVFMVLFLTLAISVSAQEGTTIDMLNVRTGPDTGEAVITEIARGTSVVIEGRNSVGNWILIHTSDGAVRGWVASRYVNFPDGVELAMLPVTDERLGAPAPTTVETAPEVPETQPNIPAPSASGAFGATISDLNVRIGPGTGNVALGQIPRGAVVTIEGRNNIGDWILVRTADGSLRGWVASRYVNFGDGVSLNNLPVTGEVMGTGAAAPETSAPAAPQVTGAGAMATLYSLMNVRQGPGGEHKSLGQLQANTIVVVEARNAIGNWVIIHTVDNITRGWVASRYVNFGGTFNLGSLPIVNEIIGETQLQPGDVATGLPTDTSEQMVDRLRNTPILHNMTSGKVFEIFERGKALGNRAQVFMLMGDSVTATQPFMDGFGSNAYDLGPYGYLQATIDFFSVSPRPNFANSFVNPSIAAQSGFTSAAVFDGAWVNPAVCDEAPLYCEYNQIKPSVAVILFGPVDVRVIDPYTFQANMYRMVKDLIDRGVIPVVNTFANHPNFNYDKALLYNTIILNVSRDYDIPLINLWLATQSLPDYGINVSDPVHLTQGPTWYSFNGEENVYGVTMRNLITLQALEELRRSVLTG
jgi:uncharacterized protein YraI